MSPEQEVDSFNTACPLAAEVSTVLLQRLLPQEGPGRLSVQPRGENNGMLGKVFLGNLSRTLPPPVTLGILWEVTSPPLSLVSAPVK